MYLIARPSGPPLYPPPLYLYLSERGRRGGAGGGGGGGGGAVPPGSWGRWRSVTDGAESQNSQPQAKFIPQNFPQGAQIYLIREMWREGCVFQCVCVCVCVCVLGSKYVQRKLRKPGRLSWLTQSPSASNLWRPQPPPPPLHRHTHTHSTLSKRPFFSAPPPEKKWNTDRHRPYDGYTCRQLCIPSNALGVLLWNWHTHTKGNYKRQTLCVPYVMPHWISGRNRQGLFLVLFLIPPPSPFWWMTLRCEYSGTWWSPVSLLQRLQVLQSDHQRCQAVVKLPNQNFFFSKKERSSLATSTIRRGFLF